MYLQRVELQGFKSFAQKTVLEFPAPGKGCVTSPGNKLKTTQLERGICGVTAIVGPNGSGKSNIVDAVRWVLGEQSPKLLRGKKSTDVIFSGSASKSKMGLAEVSLHLNNEDGSAPIDYTEIVITRRLYQDGNSEYLLNKSQVRLFDVVMLLAKANFGHNTYSVIGQGMVDKIVNYSSQERKEFFDEATGVKQYQIKRDRSVNKLKRSRDNLEQAGILVAELEPRLKSLTRQVNRLHKRQVVENELKDTQVMYYGKKWLDLDGSYQEYAIAFTGREKKRGALENTIGDLQEQLDELSLAESRSEEFSRIQQQYDRLMADKNSKLKELTVVKGKIDLEYVKIGKQDITWLENRRDELRTNIKNLEAEVFTLNKQVDRLNEVVNAKSEEQKKVLDDFQSLEEKLLQAQKDFQSDLGVSEKEIRQVATRIYSLQKDFIGKIKTTHNIDNLLDLKTEAEIVFGEIESFYDRITNSHQKKQQPEEIVELQSKLSDFLQKKDFLVNEINDVKIKLEVAISQKNSLLGKISDLQGDLTKVNGDLEKNKIEPTNQDELSKQLIIDREALEKEVDNYDEKIRQAREKLDIFNDSEEEKKKKIFAIQQNIHSEQLQLNEVTTGLNEIKVELAKIETKKEDLFTAMRYDLGENYNPKSGGDHKDVNLEEAELKINKLKKQLDIIGGTDPAAEEEHNEVKERYDFLTKQSEDLTRAIGGLEKVVIELDKMIKDQFESEFKKINKDFSNYFKQLFDGGNAKLVLTQKELTEADVVKQEIAETVEGEELSDNIEVEEVVEEEEKKVLHVEDKSFLANMGIDIEVNPPGKKIKNVSSLSGGEKTMTALALVSAIIANNPSPFVILDEVDAALDEANSNKFGNILEDLSHKTQFVVITHNRAVMARSDVLYGVTMQGDGVSRLLSLKLEEAKKMAK
jgi:chromosome segregation protein